MKKTKPAKKKKPVQREPKNLGTGMLSKAAEAKRKRKRALEAAAKG